MTIYDFFFLSTLFMFYFAIFQKQKANDALFVLTKGLMLKFLKPAICQILVNIARHTDCLGVAY